MQRAKHADRKKQTRARMMMAAGVESAGAADLGLEEIEAELADSVETSGEPALTALASAHQRSAFQSDEEGSAANRRGCDMQMRLNENRSGSR